jgi:hypothetical protein
MSFFHGLLCGVWYTSKPAPLRARLDVILGRGGAA